MRIPLASVLMVAGDANLPKPMLLAPSDADAETVLAPLNSLTHGTVRPTYLLNPGLAGYWDGDGSRLSPIWRFRVSLASRTQI